MNEWLEMLPILSSLLLNFLVDEIVDGIVFSFFGNEAIIVVADHIFLKNVIHYIYVGF